MFGAMTPANPMAVTPQANMQRRMVSRNWHRLIIGAL
jgi:hypothetical protein